MRMRSNQGVRAAPASPEPRELPTGGHPPAAEAPVPERFVHPSSPFETTSYWLRGSVFRSREGAFASPASTRVPQAVKTVTIARTRKQSPRFQLMKRGLPPLAGERYDAASHAAATASMVVSSSVRAMTCRPTGKPAEVGAQGTLMAGNPARLAGNV
jgi:hypothetical protein